MKLNARYDHFQIMRGVACLMVFLNHVVGLLSQPLDFSGKWYGPLIVPLGFPWVWLFLILSGFLLTKQFSEARLELNFAGIVKFYRRRFRRLIPMLWFAPLLFGSFYYLGIWSTDLPPFHILREISVAMAFPWVPYSLADNPVASVNSPVWSAVLEVHYFLLLPLVLWITRMSPRLIIAGVGAWLLGIGFLAYGVLTEKVSGIFPMIYQQHFYNVGFMLAGSALALVKKKPGRRNPLAWAIASMSVCLVANQYLVARDLDLALAVMPAVMLPAMIVLVASCDSGFQARLPQGVNDWKLTQGPSRWIELGGMMSYSIYLLHKPLSFIAINLLGIKRTIDGLPSLALGTLATALVVLPIIVISFSLVEVRFRKAHGKMDMRPPTSAKLRDLPIDA